MARKREPKLMNSVRELRSDIGWTQQELATQVGVTRQTIIAMEGGGYTPSLALALRIAQVFQQPVEKIFQLDDQSAT